MRNALLIAAVCALFAAAPAHGRDVILWYDDQGEEHSVTMQEPGPREQQILEDKIARERGIPPAGSSPPAVSEGLDSTSDAARSVELQQQYDALKTERQQTMLRAQLKTLEARSNAIDREMQEIRQEISYKRYRRNRIFSRNKNKRIRLAYEINQLDNTLEQLAEMKMGVEVKKHALTTQLIAR